MKKHVHMTFYVHYDVVVEIDKDDDALAEDAAYELVKEEVDRGIAVMPLADFQVRPDYDVDDNVEDYQ